MIYFCLRSTFRGSTTLRKGVKIHLNIIYCIYRMIHNSSYIQIPCIKPNKKVPLQNIVQSIGFELLIDKHYVPIIEYSREVYCSSNFLAHFFGPKLEKHSFFFGLKKKPFNNEQKIFLQALSPPPEIHEQNAKKISQSVN